MFGKLLEKRFGPLPELVLARIGSAKLAALDLWVDRFEAAKNLDDVFYESH